MQLIAAFLKPVLPAVLGLILMQFGGFDTPQDAMEDPFARATTPTQEFVYFNFDFSQMDLDTTMTWVNPSLGLVKDGVLLTADEAREVFRQDFYGAGQANIIELNLVFNYGEFTGANTYMADTWVEYKILENGVENWYRFHNQFVFKIMNMSWYLIQSEYIPADSGGFVTFDYGTSSNADLPDWMHDYIVDYSGTQVSGVISWPLLIGRNFADATELHPLEGTTPAGGTWKLVNSADAGKPVVLFFFSVQGLYIAEPEVFEAQMDFLEGLYDTFGYQDLHIYGATDDTREELDWIGESGYTGFAPLLDEGSQLHQAMNINEHPYVVIFDGDGTVVALTRSWHPSNLSLLEDRIREVVESANAQS